MKLRDLLSVLLPGEEIKIWSLRGVTYVYQGLVRDYLDAQQNLELEVTNVQVGTICDVPYLSIDIDDREFLE